MFYFPIAQVIEHPLRERELAGLIPGRVGFEWLSCLVLSNLRQALASLLLINTAQLTSHHLQKHLHKCRIIIIVCIDRRTVWKIGSHTKYIILLNNKNKYYYYYNYFEVICQTPVSKRWFKESRLCVTINNT